MNKVLKEILSTGVYLLIVMVLTYLVITFVGQRTEVSGDSMEPTLSNEDNLIVDKITYRFKDPERFDIIVFPFQYKEDTYYIKRIIGLPGETIQIAEDGTIYVDKGNGFEVLQESYGREIIKAERLGLAAEPITLGKDEYFVLGDNVNSSEDSRFAGIGNIKDSQLIGKVWLKFQPLNELGFIE